MRKQKDSIVVAEPRNEVFGSFTLRLIGEGKHVASVSIHTERETHEDAGDDAEQVRVVTEHQLTHAELVKLIPARAYLFTASGVARDVPAVLVDKIRRDLERFAVVPA